MDREKSLVAALLQIACLIPQHNLMSSHFLSVNQFSTESQLINKLCNHF